MTKSAYLKHIALFLIMLVINMTIYSSLVFASFPVGVSGSDGVANFKDEKDETLYVNATVDIISDSKHTVITEKQLYGTLTDSFGGSIAFNSFNECESQVGIDNKPRNIFDCYLTLNLNDIPPTQNSLTLIVYLNNTDNITVDDSGNIDIYTDDKVPKINFIDVFQNNEGTFLRYNIIDNPPSSGIKELVVTEGGSQVNRTILNIPPSRGADISRSGDLKLVSVARGLDNRTYELTVIDGVGHKPTKSIINLTDYSQPSIVKNSFGIYYAGNEYYSGKKAHRLIADTPTQVTVNVSVLEDLKLSSPTTINLGIAVAGNAASNNIDLNCRPVKPGIYMCSTGEIPLTIDKSLTEIRPVFNLLDAQGNRKTESISYELKAEATAPTLIPGSFKATINGQEAHYLGLQPTVLTFSVKLNETFPGLVPHDVKLNLNSLSASELSGLTEIPAESCIPNLTTSIYDCTWAPVTITNPNRNSPISGVTLNVQDIVGNKPNTPISIPYLFEVDDTSPELRYLGTAARIRDDMNVNFSSFISSGRGNIFIADIDERQSGITKENVELTINNANKGMPNYCFKKNNELYECIWNNTDLSALQEGEVTLSLTKLEDNIGKPGFKNNEQGDREPLKSKAYVDNKKPIIEQVSVYSIGQNGPVEYHENGDVLNINAIVSDISPVKMSVDLNDLGIKENITVNCKPEDNPAANAVIKWVCEGESKRPIAVFDPEAAQERKVNLIVTDSVGNLKTIKDEIVCTDVSTGCKKLTADKVTGAFIDNTGNNGLLKIDILKTNFETTSIDLWRINTVTPTPTALDRQTFELINVRQFFEISVVKNTHLSSNANEVLEILDMSLIKNSCVADESDVGKAPFSIVKSFDIQNNKVKVKNNPILFVEYQRVNPEYNELKFTCTFSILSRLTTATGKKFLMPKPEFDNVTFVTKWSNLPIGTISSSLRDQIEHEKKAAFDDLGKTIEVLSKVMAIAKGICQLFGTLMGIIELLSAFITVLEVLKIYPPAKPAVEGACYGTGEASGATKTAWAGFGDKFCKYVSCKKTLPGLGTLLDKLYSLFPDTGAAGEGGGLDKTSKTANALSGKDVAAALSIKPDPMKSLSLAVLMGCIPGIIAAAEKHRQIHCSHALCLMEDVAGGLPIDQCHAQKSLQECKYIYGEYDSLIPWLWIVDHYSNILKTMFKDPLTLVGATVGWLCPKICSYSNVVSAACTMANFVKIAGKVYLDLDAIFQFSGKGKGGGLAASFKPQNDACEKVKELEDKEQVKVAG